MHDHGTSYLIERSPEFLIAQTVLILIYVEHLVSSWALQRLQKFL